MKKNINPSRLKDTAVVNKLDNARKGVFERFPLLFTMLATFGVVSTFYGFERLIDRIELFSENPLILLTIGLLTLIFTGTLYKKLG